jgi:hypothetical protein
MHEKVTSIVNTSEIRENDLYRISRKNFPSGLPLSIKLSGMLEVPWIIRDNSGYIAFTCHNRIKILRDIGVRSIECYVLDRPQVRVFMYNVSLKSYRNEIGPAGKMKSLLLLKERFKVNDEIIDRFCKKNLKVPEEIIRDGKFTECFFLLPDPLINYLDERDISFKIIKDLINLPVDWAVIISRWVEAIPVRVNFFKMIIDNISDIYRRGDNISVIEKISAEEDKKLYDEIYRIRYPRYMKIKSDADLLIKDLTTPGLCIDFPEYFDRDYITVKLNIDKKTDCNSQLKKVLTLNPDRLKELISLLQLSNE